MADEIPVHLILSPDLPHHRVCLDAFERIEGRRAQIEVQTLEGLLEAWIYLDAERLPSNGHPAGVALTRHHLVRSACEMLGYIPPKPGCFISSAPLKIGTNREIVLKRRQSLTRRFWAFKSEEHTSELQSLMRISYAVFCLKKKKKKNT